MELLNRISLIRLIEPKTLSNKSKQNAANPANDRWSQIYHTVL